MTIPIQTAKRPVNIVFLMLIDDPAVPVQGPGFIVPTGCTVYVRGVNGSDAGNAKPIRVGADSNASLNGPYQVVNPNTQVPYPCVNTAEIVASGSAGDGAQILITG